MQSTASVPRAECSGPVSYTHLDVYKRQISGDVRTLSPETSARFPRLVTELADGIAAAHGLTAQVDWSPLYPPTVNDAAEAAFVSDTLARVFGPERVSRNPDPRMGSEDFSFVLREVPGCYFFLHCTPPEVDPADAGWNLSLIHI